MPYSLTVEENLTVVGRLYGLSNVAGRIDEMVKKLEMEEMASQSHAQAVFRPNDPADLGQSNAHGTENSVSR